MCERINEILFWAAHLGGYIWIFRQSTRPAVVKTINYGQSGFFIGTPLVCLFNMLLLFLLKIDDWDDILIIFLQR